MEEFSNYTPILKWAGGKRQLMPELLKSVPEHFNTYFEPFVGGAALLFSLYSQRRLRKAIISDVNEDLYKLYSVIKKDPHGLAREMERMAFQNNSEDYYRARDRFNSTSDIMEKSALLIYLNRHCFNGLYRVNSRNQFNVPFGRYSNPEIPSESVIMDLSVVFKSCTILNSDFEETVMDATEGDFVYFDPPYIPLSRTASFTDYTSKGFSMKDQERLLKTFQKLNDKGVMVMESNSDTPIIKEMYSQFFMRTVSARRSINSKGMKRKGGTEVIITNYEVPDKSNI
ncbi:MAG: DNA adenine methylase [Cuniculiplasma sp.]